MTLHGDHEHHGTVGVSEQTLDVAITDSWSQHPQNPLNWHNVDKTLQVTMLAAASILSSMGSSIISPAHDSLMKEFDISSTVALLPLSLYVLALGLGPVVGGPLSESIGRYPVYVAAIPLGALCTLGSGFTLNFSAICCLRFMTGLCWAPVLSVAAGSMSDTFAAESRGIVGPIFIVMPFLGPGLGPVIGSFLVEHAGWRWTQWTLIFFAIVTMILTLSTRETSHPIIQKRLAKERGDNIPVTPPLAESVHEFIFQGLIRPFRMLFFEPIVGFICLYVSIGFGILFSFFAVIPYAYDTIYHFGSIQSGLVFLSVVIGSLLGFATSLLCEIFLYRKQIPKHPLHKVPPEHRLYPAMFGSIGYPMGLFWFAWTTREDISWVCPAAAIIPFAWGNLCIFLSIIQYITDTYPATVVASAASANSLSRYGFAGSFPLFILQSRFMLCPASCGVRGSSDAVFRRLGIAWATSLLGFVSLLLLPIPWVLFKYGPKIRARSRYSSENFGGG